MNRQSVIAVTGDISRREPSERLRGRGRDGVLQRAQPPDWFEQRLAAGVPGTAHVRRVAHQAAGALGLEGDAAVRLAAALLCAWPLLGREAPRGRWVRLTALRDGSQAVLRAEGPGDFSAVLRRGATGCHEGWGISRLAGCADDVIIRSAPTGTYLELRLTVAG